MSVEALAMVLHHSRAKGTAKVVAIGIANHDGDGGSWPSIGTLARYANVDRSNAKKAIRHLSKPTDRGGLGEVRVYVQEGGLRDTPDEERTNRYEVLVECPEGCDRTTRHKPRPGWKRDDDGEYVRVDSDTDVPLWITGGGDSAPGGGDAPTPRGGDAPRTVPVTTHTQDSASVTGPRASGDTPPCRLCSAPNLDVCRERDAKVRHDLRHDYEPSR